jgi:8-oxo-dGTP pyrophosphatase MutT (NUDIX family)
VDVYAVLRRADGQVLLLERANTGYADGQLCPPSGHLEAGETVPEGVIREANEEIGVVIEPADLGSDPVGSRSCRARTGCTKHAHLPAVAKKRSPGSRPAAAG